MLRCEQPPQNTGMLSSTQGSSLAGVWMPDSASLICTMKARQ